MGKLRPIYQKIYNHKDTKTVMDNPPKVSRVKFFPGFQIRLAVFLGKKNFSDSDSSDAILSGVVAGVLSATVVSIVLGYTVLTSVADATAIGKALLSILLGVVLGGGIGGVLGWKLGVLINKILIFNLSGSNLRKVNLNKANLSGTDLSDADLSGADLSDADLSGAKLYRIQGLTLKQVKQAKNWDKACYDPVFATELGLSAEQTKEC